jgi:hypothetical protein
MAAITKPQLAAIRADINAALAAVAKKHGVDFNLGNIRFTPETFSGKLTGTVRGAAGASTAVPTDPKLVAFLTRGARLLGKPSINENDKFKSQSLGVVHFVGYNSRAHAYPYIVKQATTNKRYKISTMAAQNMVAAGMVL